MIHTSRPVTARPTSAQVNRFMPVMVMPVLIFSEPPKPVVMAIVTAIRIAEMTPVTARPLYSAPMMLLELPSFTK